MSRCQQFKQHRSIELIDANCDYFFYGVNWIDQSYFRRSSINISIGGLPHDTVIKTNFDGLVKSKSVAGVGVFCQDIVLLVKGWTFTVWGEDLKE